MEKNYKAKKKEKKKQNEHMLKYNKNIITFIFK